MVGPGRGRALILVGSLALLGTGCNFAPPAPLRPELAAGEPGGSGPLALETPPPLPPEEAEDQGQLPPPPERAEQEERLQAGVVLSIQVTDEPALSVADARVGRDGAVFVPFLGLIAARGLTPLELGARLEAALRERGYLRAPQVHVEVRERSGRRAYVLGQVGRPGAYDLPFHQELTLSQLIALAGGLTTNKADLEADPAAIRLIRREGAERRSYRIAFTDVVQRGDTSADVTIQDQDVVYVPPKGQLFIFGSVRQPGGYALADRGRLGVDEALGLAGGFAENADVEGLLLVRRGPDGARTYRIPSEPEARAGIQVTSADTLIVPSRTTRRVYVLGSVARQGGVPLDEPDLTVTKVLALAGGLDRIAASNSVRLIRRGPDGVKRVYSVPVAEIISSGDLDRDPVLLPGDIIWVPEGFF